MQLPAACQSMKAIATAVVRELAMHEDTDDAGKVDSKAVLPATNSWRTSEDEALASDIRQFGSYVISNESPELRKI